MRVFFFKTLTSNYQNPARGWFIYFSQKFFCTVGHRNFYTEALLQKLLYPVVQKISVKCWWINLLYGKIVKIHISIFLNNFLNNLWHFQRKTFLELSSRQISQDFFIFFFRGVIGGKTSKTEVLPWFSKIEHGSGISGTQHC